MKVSFSNNLTSNYKKQNQAQKLTYVSSLNTNKSSPTFTGLNTGIENVKPKSGSKMALALAGALFAVVPATKVLADVAPSPAVQAMIDGANIGRAQGKARVEMNDDFWNNLDPRTRQLAYNLETKEADYFVNNMQLIPEENIEEVAKNIGAKKNEQATVKLLMQRYSAGEQTMGIPFMFRLSPERQKIWKSVDYNAGMYTMGTGRLVNLSKENVNKLMQRDGNNKAEDFSIYAIALLATNKILSSAMPFGLPSGDL